jgi:putative ABC transport system permease protein
MAFSVCLVTVAAFFLAILLAYSRKALPYNPTQVLTAQIALEGPRYDSEPARRELFDALVTRLAASPGVRAAGLNSSQSLRSSPQMRIELEGRSYPRDQDRPLVTVETVSTGFFPVMNVRPRQGRDFTASDDGNSLSVAIVNTEFITHAAAGQDLLGRRFRIAGAPEGADGWVTIVGIVPDVGNMKAGVATRGPTVYRPLSQVPERTMTVMLRTNGAAALLSNTVRREVALLDAQLPVSRIQTVAEILELERIGMNAFGSLFVLCGFGALALAAVGIYGVVAFAVRMRTREFGVRLALGATPAAIVRLVMKQGLRQIAIGLGIGVLLAFAASAALSSSVQGFTRTISDAWIYAGVALLLGSVGAVALAIPAIRGSRVDPMVALRAD